MFNIAIIILLCLMAFHPSLGMEETKPCSTKSGTLQVHTEVISTPKRYEDNKNVDITALYIARSEEMNIKSILLLDESTDLGVRADNLSTEALRLANIARNSSGSIEIIQEAYISAEKAYRKAAKAYNKLLKVELAAAKVELAAAKAEKELYELNEKSNIGIISNVGFAQNEHVIKAQSHMALRKESKDNAKAANDFILVLQQDSNLLRLERKEKIRLLQESTCKQSHSISTNLESPSSQFGSTSHDNPINSPDEANDLGPSVSG